MPNSLTALGLTTQNYDELIAYYVNNFLTIYGSDINLSSSTSDGQWLNILTQGNLDNLDLITQVYNSFDPDNAVGVVLDQHVAINGIQRIAGTYSQTNITLVLSQVVTLYGLDQSTQPIYTVSDNIGNQWQLLTTQTEVGPSGNFVAVFQSAVPGEVLTIPNTINIPVTVILGVTSVNNPSTQTVIGTNEESDAQLRVRRQQSVSQASQGYLAGLYAELADIPNIISSVYENDGSTTDSEGVPGHSIWVLINGVPEIPLASAWNSAVTYSWGQVASEGGVNYISWQNNNLNHMPPNALYWGVYNSVAMAIYYKRNAGCGMFGEQSYVVTQIDGSQFTVNWDSVSQQNLFTFFTAVSLNGITPPNIQSIVEQLPALLIPEQNQSVNITELGTLVQSIDPNTVVENAGFSNGFLQTLNLSAAPSSGSFSLTYGGSGVTAAINWNDPTSTIQTKLQAVSGLGTALVTGSLASKQLIIQIPDIVSCETLITVSDNPTYPNTLGVTFSYNENIVGILSPTSRKYQLFPTSQNTVVTIPPVAPFFDTMILSPTSITLDSNTQQVLSAVGGYYNDPNASYIYTIVQNQSGCTLTPQSPSTTVLYTSGNGSGDDIIIVTDALGNFGHATMAVE